MTHRSSSCLIRDCCAGLIFRLQSASALTLALMLFCWHMSSSPFSRAADAGRELSADADTVELSGYSAEVTGPSLKVQKGTLGHWHSADTEAHWNIAVAQPCTAEVEVVAAVQKPFAGSQFVVRIGADRLTGTLSDTGGWDAFKVFQLGSLQLAQGNLRITLQPTLLPRGVFGNVQSVRLHGVRLQQVQPSPPTDLSGPIRVFTSARNDGTRISQRDSLSFGPSTSSDTTLIAIDPRQRFQTIEGFGGAFTEAAAYVYSRLSPTTQQEFLRAYFDKKQGHGYRLCRTHINSCDFCLASYAYDDVPGDVDLEHFTIAHDRELLIPLIRAAQNVTGDEPIKILSSPWSPPAWMKTNGKVTEGGQLKPEYRSAWAQYYCRYIHAYRKEGIDIWGITVQNEPMATQRWESCLYSHEEERDFVRDYLGPALHENGCQQTKILVWDHNRDLLFHRAKTVFDDPDAAKYVWGAGFHWYVTDDFNHVNMVHEFYPDKKLLFTEGCLENGVHASDWSAGERYARSVINDLNHWAVGWIDWNLMLDTQGGPNHVQNYCSAPIIGDVDNDRLIYNSSYYYLGHFSRFIRPGAVRVLCENTGDELMTTAFLNPDEEVAVIVFNPQGYPIPYSLQVGGVQASRMSPAHSITTLCFNLTAAKN